MCETRIVTAAQLKPEHHFELSGSVYVVEENSPNLYNDRVIDAALICNPDEKLKLVIGRAARIKIHAHK